VKYGENGKPTPYSVESEGLYMTMDKVDGVRWLAPIPSYGIPIEGGEDAFIAAHVEVSRKRGILDQMRRDISGSM